MAEDNSVKKLLSEEIYFNPPAKILVIDDSRLNREFIINAFQAPNFQIYGAANGEEGCVFADEKLPEVILLDIMMPSEDGYEICRKIKNNPATEHTPVIFLTANDSIQNKLKGFDAGAVDFITKPFNYRELIARVKTQVLLSRMTAEKEKMIQFAMEEKRAAVISQIAAGVSHNFSNLLLSSFGNLMLVESMLDKNFIPAMKEAITDLRKSLERQKALILQFLRLANRGGTDGNNTPAPAEIKLDLLLQEISENITIREIDANKLDSVGFDITIPENTIITCDPEHAREIFHLILDEIIKRAVGTVQFRIFSSVKGENSSVICHINVNGFTIDKKIREQIFEPFALPFANVGTGLAFSVAKHLVELNGGGISALFPADNEICLDLTFKSHL